MENQGSIAPLRVTALDGRYLKLNYAPVQNVTGPVQFNAHSAFGANASIGTSNLLFPGLTVNSVVMIEESITDLDLGGGLANGLTIFLEVNPAGAVDAGIVLFDFESYTKNTSTFSVTQYTTSILSFNHIGSGSITRAYAGNLIAGGNLGTGRIFNFWGQRVLSFSKGASATTDLAIAILLDPQTSATDNWQLYAFGATSKNYIQGSLAIGTETLVGKVTIKGTSNTIQQALQGNSTQTSDLEQHLDSSGNVHNRFVLGGATSGENTINEQGAELNFRVESDTDANLLFLEGTGAGNVLVGTTTITDSIAGNDRFKVVEGTMSLGFRDHSSGQGWLVVSNGTIIGFTGHTNSLQGFTVGPFSDHPMTLRGANNIGAFQIQSNGLTIIQNAGITAFSTANAQLDIRPNASTIGLIVQVNATTPGNAFEVRNSSSTPLTYIESDGEIIIDQDSKGIKFGADQDITLWSTGSGDLVITPLADTDITLTFVGTTNSGVLKWMEDEDYFQFNDDILVSDAENIIFGTGTGTKIGTATSQKLSLWNATPIVQPTTAVAEATFVENSGGAVVNVDSTFGGYTLQQVVQALQNIGALA